jgi:AraC-like DNA-binding protein
MTSHKYIPESFIKEFVECIYVNQSNSFDHHEIVLPSIQQEVFFNFGDQFALTNQRGAQLNQLRAWVSGAQTKVAHVSAMGKHITIGALFKPYGLYAGFGLNGKKVANMHLDVSHLFGHDIYTDIRKKIDGLSHAEIAQLLEVYIVDSYKPKRANKQVIEFALSLNDMEFHKGFTAGFAAQFHRSSKSFIQIFNDAFGIAPIKFFQLQAISSAIEQIKSAPTKPLTTIAVELGFFDQSHFIRTFRSFCGVPPGQWRKKFLSSR